ncbi:MAG: AI-2E family transporter, partial [Muriicola sp.]|nr:AI-2E family transporter [Muriicola sp.]
MNPIIISKGILRAVGIMAGIILVCYFLYTIQSVLAYIALAAVVALIGRPVVYFLRKRLKLPNTLAVVITMILMVGILAGIVAMFFPLISEQASNLSLLNIEELRI